MKKIIYILILTAFCACGKSGATIESADALNQLKKELISKFGSDAHYTSLNILNSGGGSILNVSQTNDPSSLKMTEWSQVYGSWTQNSDITLEISGKAKAENFMFQLDKIVDFNVLGKSLEAAKKKVMEEKGIKEVAVKNILINAPNDGNFKSMKYFITLEPKTGGTSFDFFYNMDGTLDKFDY